MDFAAFLAPLPPERFLAEHYGRGPLHVPAAPGSERSAILDWEALNALIGIQGHWGGDNIRLMRGGKPIARDLYMEEVIAQEGPIERASPARIDALLATGASLVGQSVQQISPVLRDIALMLAERLRGRVTANVYCSFEGVAAFPLHFDSHEVFAVHTEGEKVWRIYDDPVDRPLHGAACRPEETAPSGERKMLMEAVMRPGDLLYIPRGYRHEALASARESLHVTFSVDPPAGAALFRLLREAALRDPAFRAYLPDACDGGALAAHLDALAGRLAAIVRSPAFHDEVATAQQKLAPRRYRMSLPHRPTLDFYARTRRSAMLERTETGALLAVPDGEALALGAFREEAEWILAHPLFSLQQLAAAFPHRTDDALSGLVAMFEGADLLRPVRPAG